MTAPRHRHARAAAFRVFAVVAVLLTFASCTGGGRVAGDDPGTATPAAGPFAACPQPTGPAEAGVAPVPDIALPCLAGGGSVSLARAFGKPTVINFWASWCAPCRDELPAFQRYADRVARDAPGAVLVIGVVTGDRRDAAASLAADLGIHFPALYDADRVVTRQLGRNALPVTLLLDAQGRLVHLYQAEPLTDRTLALLVEKHLKLNNPRLLPQGQLT